MAEPTENQLAARRSLLETNACSGEQNTWLLDLITKAELLKPSQPLSDQGARLTVNLWGKTLSEIGEARFESAFLQALESSPHRPDISEIRRFAGLDTESAARRELAALVATMRVHGRKLQRREVAPGRIMDAPAISPRMEAVLLDLGVSDRQAGLDFVWGHPTLNSMRSGDENERLGYPGPIDGARIERRWIEAWGRAGA
jgi:hypothetical protein